MLDEMSYLDDERMRSLILDNEYKAFAASNDGNMNVAGALCDYDDGEECRSATDQPGCSARCSRV
jgi:hypothetical protein